MNKVPVYNLQGETQSSINLPASLFGAEVNNQLIHQAVRVYLSNQRQSSAKTQTRSDVSLTTKKAYRQKGTGNARHGAKSAPIYVGGGVAHGPTGLENYKLKMSKKMRRGALISALSWLASNNKVIVLDSANDLDGTTQTASAFLKSIKLANVKSALVVSKIVPNVVRSWKNLGKSSLINAQKLTTYEVINSGVLIIDKSTIDFLVNFFLPVKQNNSSKQSIQPESPKSQQPTVSEELDKSEESVNLSKSKVAKSKSASKTSDKISPKKTKSSK